MPPATRLSLIGCVVAWSCAPIASAATITAASNRATAPSDANAAAVIELLGVPASPIDRQLAQSFLTVNGGLLRSLSVTAGARAGLAQQDGLGLRVALAELDEGLLGPVLATAPVEDVERLPGFGGPFSQPDVLQATATFEGATVWLQAGVSYAMVFQAERFDDSFFILGGSLAYPDGGSGSRTGDDPFRFSPISDLFFEVTVEAVPEPTSLVLLAGTGFAIAARRPTKSRRQSRAEHPHR